MIIVREDRSPKDNAKVLRDISNLLEEISISTNQLARHWSALNLYETFIKFEEGTMEQRRQVEMAVNDLNRQMKELNKVVLLFNSKDTSIAIAEKQSHLNKAKIAVDAIQRDMLAVWSIRNAGDTPEDNTVIQDIIKVMFAAVNGLLKKIDQYVEDFNKESYVKLNFKVKWTPLPK